MWSGTERTTADLRVMIQTNRSVYQKTSRDLSRLDKLMKTKELRNREHITKFVMIAEEHEGVRHTKKCHWLKLVRYKYYTDSTIPLHTP